MAPRLWIFAGIGLIALFLFLTVAGTFVSYFIASVAIQHLPRSPFAVVCTQLAPPSLTAVRVRFDVTNAGRKDARWMNFAMFAAGYEHRNVSDWGYAFETRVPAGVKTSKVVAVPLNDDYRGLQFSSVHCNLLNVVFEDGSEQDYATKTGVFP